MSRGKKGGNPTNTPLRGNRFFSVTEKKKRNERRLCVPTVGKRGRKKENRPRAKGVKGKKNLKKKKPLPLAGIGKREKKRPIP